MLKVVIVNGMPRTGKTTMQQICSEKLNELGWKCAIKSSVDWVKDIAKYAGWNGEKTDENRKFLSNLKRVLTEWDDAVLKNLIEVVDYFDSEYDNYIVFIDIREPLEIARAKNEFNATTLLIRRPQVEDNTYSNSSDMGVFEYEYDMVIYNEGNIKELEKECDKFLNQLLVNSDNIYGNKYEK